MVSLPAFRRRHLRLLKGPHIDRDAVVQIPSWRGNFVAWVNTPGAWNGFLPFKGQRRALMINYIWRPGVDRNLRVHLLHTPGTHPLLEHLPPAPGGNDTFVIVNAPPPGAPPPPSVPESPPQEEEAEEEQQRAAEVMREGPHEGIAWSDHPLAQAVRPSPLLTNRRDTQPQWFQQCQFRLYSPSAACRCTTSLPHMHAAHQIQIFPFLLLQVVVPGEAEARSFSGFSVRNDAAAGCVRGLRPRVRGLRPASARVRYSPGTRRPLACNDAAGLVEGGEFVPPVEWRRRMPAEPSVTHRSACRRLHASSGFAAHHHGAGAGAGGLGAGLGAGAALGGGGAGRGGAGVGVGPTHFHAHTLTHAGSALHHQPVGGRSSALSAPREQHLFSQNPLAGGHFFESLAAKVSEHRALSGQAGGLLGLGGDGGGGGVDFGGGEEEEEPFRRRE